MAKPSRTADAPDTPASYEQALAELERLIGAMELGQLPLDDMLQSHRRAAVLLGYCRERLALVEGQVKLLDDGQLKDWAT